MLKEIIFSYEEPGHEPVTRLTLTTKAEFKLAKRSEREYLLAIQGCKLSGRHLSLAQYPPQDFDGITYIAATSKNGNVDIAIGVDRGVKLSAFFKDGEIWVRPVKPATR